MSEQKDLMEQFGQTISSSSTHSIRKLIKAEVHVNLLNGKFLNGKIVAVNKDSSAIWILNAGNDVHFVPLTGIASIQVSDIGEDYFEKPKTSAPRAVSTGRKPRKQF